MKMNSTFDMLTVDRDWAAELEKGAQECVLQSVLIQQSAIKSSKCAYSLRQEITPGKSVLFLVF